MNVKSFLRKYLHLLLCFCALYGNTIWFQLLYAPAQGKLPWLYSAAWSLLFTAVAALLPRLVRRIYLGLLGAVFALLPIVHAVYFNMFRKFFSFADMTFAGDGFAFLDPSYLVIRKLAIALDVLCLAVMIAAIVLAPKVEKGRWRGRVIAGAVGVVVAVGVIAGTTATQFKGEGAMSWDMASDPATIYENFNDTKAAMGLLGLYHYTFRDVQISLFPAAGSISADERQEIEDYAAARPHAPNDMTGVLKGKNLILIQLEAIDTWMLDGYMPNLKAVKEQSVVFTNHYTPAYITAGTFNSEYMVNTGLFPAANGISTSVYTRNSYPNSLAHLFADEGYSANSFHGSERQIYDRGAIHEAWGYTYHSGSDMQMHDYQFDSDMDVAFPTITAGDKFFSFIITYSGHGPYREDNGIFQAHAEEARAQATRTDGNYVYAVGHCMETDLFIQELMDYLDTNGFLENTALIFYADHYNYYMLDDGLNMDIKGVDHMNLLNHTDFFIYSKDLQPRQVDKYTSSLDVLPTIANLFDLDADYPYLAGDDAFSPGGGYVIFPDNTWLGTDRDVSAELAQRRRVGSLILRGDYWG